MHNVNRKPSTAAALVTKPGKRFGRYLPLLGVAILMLASGAFAQGGFATTEITNPIRTIVTIANATIAGLAVLVVIMLSIRWMGGDEGAAKKIILTIVAAVIALSAANFLGFVTGRDEFEAIQ